MLLILWNILRLVLVLILLACTFLYFFGAIPTLKRYRLIQKLPGPKGVFFFGYALELLKVPSDNTLEWFVKLFKDYDRLMSLWLMGLSNVYMKDPNDIQVLFNNLDHTTKGIEYFVVQPWLKEGLLTSKGDKWHSRRKILTPAFHFKILEDNMIIFNNNAKILCSKFEDNEGKDLIVENFISLCTLDVIIRTAMGINIDAQSAGGQEYVNELKKLSKIFTHRLMSPHIFSDYTFYLSPSGRKFRKAVNYLHEFTSNVIKEKKAKQISNNTSFSEVSSSSSGKVLKAFLDRILEHESKHPGSFTDSGIQEEVDTFMFEGHDTTSVALVYIFFNLAKYQDVQEKVYEEQNEIFGSSDRDVTVNDLNRMVYLEKVIKECLRLYPSVPVVSRLLEKDLVLSDGITLPVFTNVVVPIYVLHRNEKYWPDPDKFDPERFSEKQIQGRNPYAYIPFSAGPRNCIGQKFAMMELKTVVSNVIRKLKILPVTKEELKLVVLIVLRSVFPIKCKFIKR